MKEPFKVDPHENSKLEVQNHTSSKFKNMYLDPKEPDMFVLKILGHLRKLRQEITLTIIHIITHTITRTITIPLHITIQIIHTLQYSILTITILERITTHIIIQAQQDLHWKLHILSLMNLNTC